MDYHSGDPRYDAMRNIWNKYTYVVFRNGEKLFWLESEDLEVYEWAFPHSDIAEELEREFKETTWKDEVKSKGESISYRVTKYMTFLQGLLDQRPDIMGPFSVRPNLMRLEGVDLVRDDENLIGTGRKTWEEFRNEKNALIRRGTRVLYLEGRKMRSGTWERSWNSGGEHIGYYRSEYTEPQAPATGIYHADTIEVVDHYEDGRPVRKVMDRLIFRYNPGDTVYDHSTWDYEGHERKNRLPWKYEKNAVLNYDAVTIGELREYLNDRSLRPQFREMMPILKKMLLFKEDEERQEKAFVELIQAEVAKELGHQLDEKDGARLLAEIELAVKWWKDKVIYTRTLRSDDGKAWRMIKTRVLKCLKDEVVK